MKWRRIWASAAAGLAASLATAAAPTAHAQSAATPIDSETLEIRWARTGQPMVKPIVNGVELGWFILDSGAGMLAIAPSAAERAGLRDGEDIEVVGVGGRAQKRVVIGESLELAGVSIDTPRFVALEELDNPLARFAFGAPVAGVLGHDYFQRAVIEINKPNDTVAVRQIAPDDVPEDAWIPLRIVNRLPLVAAAFDGGEGEFLLDTGANGSATFYAHAVERLNLLEGRQTRRSMRLGVGGGRAQVRGELAWLRLGGARLEAVAADFSTHADERERPADVVGAIGMGLMGRGRVVFDYNHGRFAFIAASED